ncbi:lipid II flippase Amj family protein [Fictibacillus sp. Mic-4]|uniref:lipid II flippase Amj family protein n=1 Tax=Fictibacillus TaxID=1329200 RepID=UPI000407ECA7|nr:lipid II flippase Amj family protein [Fictibacillus gelatini]
MDDILIKLLLLTFIIHLIDTLAYSVRLNSVKSGQVALSFSLFNLFVLVSRTANMFQAPLIASIIDFSIARHMDPLLDLREVIFASTAGTLIGVFFIPTFLKVFGIAVKKLELTGSVPSLVVEALHVNNLKRILKKATKPSKSMITKLRFREIPKRFLLLNAIVTGIYTIGVLSANYAALLVPEDHRLSAVASSGMINGIATILLTLFVDPKSAVITDQALRGKRPYGDVKALVVLLISTKLIGTLLGQVFFIPAAELIASFYR